ncbi:Hypothetical_protein [Hexamita inflata]|uniref:Hypothetical_protein n=1 Tax=Hexamita inflata TaxID=28002 RepID=A0AA86NKY6_9EUKA|nr:Hypothetical protein HINF_LOCUS8752 [Hexamita inflata]
MKKLVKLLNYKLIIVHNQGKLFNSLNEYRYDDVKSKRNDVIHVRLLIQNTNRLDQLQQAKQMRKQVVWRLQVRKLQQKIHMRSQAAVILTKQLLSELALQIIQLRQIIVPHIQITQCTNIGNGLNISNVVTPSTQTLQTCQILQSRDITYLIFRYIQIFQVQQICQHTNIMYFVLPKQQSFQ